MPSAFTANAFVALISLGAQSGCVETTSCWAREDGRW